MNIVCGDNPSSRSQGISKLLLLVVTSLLFGADSALAASSPLKPTHLRCEYLVEPVAIDETEPRLTWALQSHSPERGQGQTAYQILVSSKPLCLEKNAGDL